MTRPRVVLIGAGVAGAVVAAHVAAHCDLVVLEGGGASKVPTNPREAMTASVGFTSEPYPAGVGLGGGSRVNGLILEHVRDSYWHQLAVEHGVSTFVDANPAEVTARIVGEEVSCLGPLDESLLRAHPRSRKARLATRHGERLTTWDRSLDGRRVLRLDSEVERVIVVDGRARSVRLVDGEEIRADHVILCAGVIGSAVLAMRSGIGGDAVGRRLFDHPSLFVPVSAPPTECPTFVGALGYESDVLTMSVNPARDAAGGFLLGLMRSSVAGRVSLEGDTVVVEREMGEDPLVRAGMLRAASRLNEMFPGAAMPSIGDEYALLSRIGEGMWHGVGTMQMGVGGDSVTDGNGLVRGTANVWCMDAAVFPVVPPVPTQGPTMVAASILAAGFVNSLTT